MAKVDWTALTGLNDSVLKELKKLKDAFKGWTAANRPFFELCMKENAEGLKAFALAVTKGESGRAEAEALNTGDDTTTKIGFAIGLAAGPMFWTWLESVLASGKLQAWVVAILKALVGVLKPH